MKILKDLIIAAVIIGIFVLILGVGMMPISQDTLIAIREFLPPSSKPPLLLYLGIGIFIGVIIVIMKFERYSKIRELFMKLF